MPILAIETSSTSGSVGLFHADKKHVRILPDQQKHSEVILNEIQQLLDEQKLSLDDLSAIAFTHGPGSFTGLRIACSIVQAISFAKNIPVIAVNTLEAIAQTAYESHQINKVLSVMDARMGEIFIAAYQKQNDQWQPVLAPILTKISDLPLLSPNDLQSLTAVGSSDLARQVAEAYQIDYKSDILLLGEAVLSLAKQQFDNKQFLTAEEAQPFYLRNKVALTMAEQRMR